MLSMIGHAVFGLIVGVVAQVAAAWARSGRLVRHGAHRDGRWLAGRLDRSRVGMVRRRSSGRIRHVGRRRDGLTAGVSVYCVMGLWRVA